MNRILSLGKVSRTAMIILIALLLFYLPTALAIFSRDGAPMRWEWFCFVMSTVYTAVFFLNYYLLAPKAMDSPRRVNRNLLINLVVIVGVCVLVAFWMKWEAGIPRQSPKVPPGACHSNELTLLKYMKFVLRDGIMMVLAGALGYAMRLSEMKESLHRRQLEISAESRKMELWGLKAQLNPHFLFNSLNNIYALIAIKPDLAQNALHDLSRMLRFMIYESDSPSVSLARDIVFISDYVRLMKLRLGETADVTFEYPEIGSSPLRVAPLIFLTLVENAFKHAAADREGRYFIHISIEYEGNSVAFKVENSCAGVSSGSITKGEAGGIGLENVRKQLSLLYPGEHSFFVRRLPDSFQASIVIEIEALAKEESN